MSGFSGDLSGLETILKNRIKAYRRSLSKKRGAILTLPLYPCASEPLWPLVRFIEMTRENHDFSLDILPQHLSGPTLDDAEFPCFLVLDGGPGSARM